MVGLRLRPAFKQVRSAVSSRSHGGRLGRLCTAAGPPAVLPIPSVATEVLGPCLLALLSAATSGARPDEQAAIQLSNWASPQAAWIPLPAPKPADLVPVPRASHAVVAKAEMPLQMAAVPAPEAAALLFPSQFPTITSARKACRRKWLTVQEKLATACTYASYQHQHARIAQPMFVLWHP